MSRRALLAGIGVAALALAAGFASRSRRGDAPAAREPADAAASTDAGPSLAASATTPAESSTEPAPPAKADIAGTVVDADGAPVARVRLTALADLEPSRPGRMLSDPRGIAITDGEGAFTVRGLTPGTYVLEARGPEGTIPTATWARTGEPATVRLLGTTPSERVVLTVLGPDGAPVAGALVTVWVPPPPRERDANGLPKLGGGAAPSDVTRAVADRQGRADLVGVTRGQVRDLKVDPPSSREDAKPLYRSGWKTGDETVRLPPGFSIRGRVVDAAGKPVEGAHVYGPTRPGGSDVHYDVLATSRRGGGFVIARLDAGDRRRLHARPDWTDDPAGNSPEVEAVVGEEVTLTLDLGIDWTVRVEGRRLGDRVLVTREAKGAALAPPHEAFTDREGVARFRSLRSDATYVVWVPAGDESDGVALVRGARPADGAATVRRTPSLSITGRLVSANALRQAQVHAWAEGVQVEGTVEEDGSYRVRGLPEGVFRLVAHADAAEDPWDTVWCNVEAPAGASTDLRLAPRPR